MITTPSERIACSIAATGIIAFVGADVSKANPQLTDAYKTILEAAQRTRAGK
jgi:hypothetical protein